MSRISRENERAAQSRAILLLMLQTALTGGGIFALLLLGLGSPGCSGRCDYEAFGHATGTFIWASLALLVGSVLGVIALRRRGARVLWPPITCIVLVAIGWAIAYPLAAGAMRAT